MADCDDDETTDRKMPDIDGAPPLVVPDPNLSALVRRATEKHELTARHDVDVHTAITAGLSSYMLTLDGAANGRSTRLESVIYDWADRNDGSRPMPSAAVHSESSASTPPTAAWHPASSP
jgi:hypothetical protein